MKEGEDIYVFENRIFEKLKCEIVGIFFGVLVFDLLQLLNLFVFINDFCDVVF